MLFDKVSVLKEDELINILLREEKKLISRLFIALLFAAIELLFIIILLIK